MYCVYILYSSVSDIYYIGHSDNPANRLFSHNNTTRITYTSKHRPWIMKAYFPVSVNRSEAMKVEKYVKSLKSRKIIEEIILKHNEVDFIKALIKKALHP